MAIVAFMMIWQTKMKAEVSEQHEINVSENIKSCYGFLLIPPVSGVLKSVPDSMPFDWVSKYRLMAAVNAEYKNNVRTSGEIIAVLVESDHEDILLNRLNAASLWLKDQIERV